MSELHYLKAFAQAADLSFAESRLARIILPQTVYVISTTRRYSIINIYRTYGIQTVNYSEWIYFIFK